MTAHTRLPAGSPINPETALDWHAALFAVVLAVLCGIGFSIFPALQATKTDVAPALKEGAALQFSGTGASASAISRWARRSPARCCSFWSRDSLYWAS